ncbi:hypothetical protein FHT93_001299 [Rhizobium sp. BK379]|nr:hypothetical protein [Rhizobium sp. BK379]
MSQSSSNREMPPYVFDGVALDQSVASDKEDRRTQDQDRGDRMDPGKTMSMSWSLCTITETTMVFFEI